ncbi:magnesium/cobalt transporter CorA [Parachitinimonas caeni]|uniref:Magnesium transport protein CorA n=1 Tax=Parachitinimonas caeni TaxID=3031301 RepID=A0ABT7DUZ4_9NEIS|nr:magnesium/cobalt transporter CorA [Parachitinimonas caeni]MDK2122950.1 magnesium/cobalt transporter CorA [Parachitinimonas caeni]
MLINCAAYQDGKKLADIPVADISEHVCLPDRFVWVAIKDPTPEEIDVMQEEFSLHDLAIEDARHGHQRPKLEEYGQTLFCVVHVLEMDSRGEIQVGEVDIFVGRNFVLSMRSRSDIGFLNVRERCENEPHLLRHGAGFVLYALIDAVVDRYFDIVHRLEGELEALEEQIFVDRSSQRRNIEQLYALKRKLVAVQHAAVPLLEAISHMYGGRVPGVCAGMQEYFRDVYDHLERIVKIVETVRDMLATAIQVNLALISLDESAVSKKFAGYGALFAVPTMIAGIYGMNFEHMPELKSLYGYPVALGAMVVLDLFLLWRFTKAGWL